MIAMSAPVNELNTVALLDAGADDVVDDAVGVEELLARVRALLRRDDDYAHAGKPVCDYDDPAAREEMSCLPERLRGPRRRRDVDLGQFFKTEIGQFGRRGGQRRDPGGAAQETDGQ